MITKLGQGHQGRMGWNVWQACNSGKADKKKINVMKVGQGHITILRVNMLKWLGGLSNSKTFEL